MLVPLLAAGTGALVGSAGFSLYREWADRRLQRGSWYEAAQNRARETEKPLLVVGDPQNGMTRGDYGFGDACVDLSGCPNHPQGNGYALSLGDALPFEDDSHVVFVCYVLEYVPDIEFAFQELSRVAGAQEDLYVLHLRDDEYAARMYPGSRYIIESGPPFAPELTYNPIERRIVLERIARSRSE